MKIIDGLEVSAEVGSWVLPDGHMLGQRLVEGDGPITWEGSWPGCDFRFPMSITGTDVSCNIKITGRTIQYHLNRPCVRVRITWVGDCEPDTYSYGWMETETMCGQNGD